MKDYWYQSYSFDSKLRHSHGLVIPKEIVCPDEVGL